MCNVPPKFNQICRLCMTLVDPKDDLSIFKSAQHKQRQSNQSNDTLRDDDDQLNKKSKRSNEISISLSGGSASVINNGFSSTDNDDDDSERDISKRIFQCLSINVSHTKFSFYLTQPFETSYRKCLQHMATGARGCCGFICPKDRSASSCVK